eukprot:TRINITY_DN10731_c0_g1_i1.p1 TRINITY_DN10731_c0_g1~~TRINITY_DN10731_c0_g1_i1.p1  ORF type:complete len:889 (+),score=198.21 TRINITY_DN10731_c0_g1_i1:272-2938(+)
MAEPEYEFNCPKYTDFDKLEENDDPDADRWFETHAESPVQHYADESGSSFEEDDDDIISPDEQDNEILEDEKNVSISSVGPALDDWVAKDTVEEEPTFDSFKPPQTYDASSTPLVHKAGNGAMLLSESMTPAPQLICAANNSILNDSNASDASMYYEPKVIIQPDQSMVERSAENDESLVGGNSNGDHNENSHSDYHAPSNNERLRGHTASSRARLEAQHQQPKSRTQTVREGELTVPISPQFSTTARARLNTATKPPVMSREEQQLAEIELARVEMKRQREESERNRLAAAESSVKFIMPARSTKPLTEPVEFHFQTDARLRGVPEHEEEASTTALQKKHKSKTMGVPKPNPLDNVHVDANVVTEPKEFRFQTEQRMQLRSHLKTATESHQTAHGQAPAGENYHSPYTVSLKTATEMIFRKTPDRFRTRPANYQQKQAQEQKLNSYREGGLTVPHEFNFQTDARSAARPKTNVESSQQKEDRLVESMNKRQFRALPLNPKILHSAGDYGVPRIRKPALTQPKEFAFATDERAAVWGDKEEELEASPGGISRRLKRRRSGQDRPGHHGKHVDQQHRQKKARMSTKKQQQKDDSLEFYDTPEEDKNRRRKKSAYRGVPQREVGMLTVPQSPHFATKERALSRPQPAPKNNYKFRARPLPSNEMPFCPAASTRPLTSPHPFALSTDKRGKEKVEIFEENLVQKQKVDKKKRQFHARPIPLRDPMPCVGGEAPVGVTIPQPFKMHVDRRKEPQAQQFRENENEKQVQAKKGHTFRAKQYHQKVPFVPSRSNKALTVVSDFQLNSDRRATDRQAFDDMMFQKDREAANAKKQLELQHKEHEEREIREMRRKMVHRPMPVRHYRPIAIEPSSQPLTEPMSPVFKTRRRAGLRA